MLDNTFICDRCGQTTTAAGEHGYQDCIWHLTRELRQARVTVVAQRTLLDDVRKSALDADNAIRRLKKKLGGIL